jgi:hypothetical protein
MPHTLLGIISAKLLIMWSATHHYFLPLHPHIQLHSPFQNSHNVFYFSITKPRSTRPKFIQNMGSFSSWTSWPLKMGPIRCPETSVKEYHSTLRNIPEKRTSHQHLGGSLKSLPVLFINKDTCLACRQTSSVELTTDFYICNKWHQDQFERK